MFDGTTESVLRTGALAERAVANAVVQHLGVTTFESTPGEPWRVQFSRMENL